jgi:hypothetical protein
MDLLVVRQNFIRQSGRYDLATTGLNFADTDAGADYFINAGSRYLDTHQEHPLSEAQWDLAMAIGDCIADIKQLRSPSQVWFTTALGVEAQLEKKRMDELLTLYPSRSLTTSGAPLIWAQVIATYAPAQLPSGIGAEYRRIMIMPPTDAAITLNVYGEFHQLELTANTEYNYWSENYGDLLVLAALMTLEESNRNTSGVNDYLTAIERRLDGIDKDLVESEFSGDAHLKG